MPHPAFIALLTALSLLSFACQDDPGRIRRAPAPQGQAAAGDPGQFAVEHLEGGELLFEDDFSSPTLGGHWVPSPHPRARVISGWLHIANNKNEPPLWLKLELPEKVRIELDVRTRSGDGDIKVELFGDGQKHQSGYILVHGAHKNAEDWFARLDEHGGDRVTRPSQGAAKDKVYHWALVRTDNRVRWYIDGEPFLMFDDPQPLRGPQHAYFGVNTWVVPLEFDNVKVFNLKGAAP